VYVPQTAANAIGVLLAADITCKHVYVSHGRPKRFMPQGVSDKERAVYIALLIILFPFAMMVVIGQLIYTALALYSQGSATVVVQLTDESYLQISRLDE
jgi:hypothetical protein